MKRAIGLLALAILAAGCTSGSKPGRDDAKSGAPAVDETRACITSYLNQCGWQNVELADVNPCNQLPSEALVLGDAWAYTFTATYTDLFGERQRSDNWLAIIARVDGKTSVKNCFDSARRLVGGHRGDERGDKASLTPLPPADELPPIVPPK